MKIIGPVKSDQKLQIELKSSTYKLWSCYHNCISVLSKKYDLLLGKMHFKLCSPLAEVSENISKNNKWLILRLITSFILQYKIFKM